MSVRGFFIVLMAMVIASAFPGCSVQKPAKVPLSASTVHVKFHGDVDFNKWDRAVIMDAAEEWSRATSGQASIEVVWDLDASLPAEVWDGQSLIVELEGADPLVQLLDQKSGASTVGLTNPPDGVHSAYGKGVVRVGIVRGRILSERILASVVLHEFGHALGLRHIPVRKSVMYYSSNDEIKPCLTQWDLSEFCAVNACDRPMKPCEN
jgi:predicted Zn-dependent protease